LDQLTILFCGATGRLGALASVLLDRGHRVLAATRDPASAAAGRLRQRGADIVRADFDDVAGLAAAAKRADAMVAAGTAHAAGPAGDVRHGRNVVDAAKAAGVGHLVYLTVAGAGQPTGVPMMDSKHAVERYLRGNKVPHTIVAPVYFMENLWNPWNAAAIAAGLLPGPVSPRRPLQQIPIADVIAFTVHALESRDEMLSERVEIASDEISTQEASAIISRLLGRSVGIADPPARQRGSLFEWLERAGTHVDVAALRRRYPQIRWHSFADWAATQDWQRLGAARDTPWHPARPLG
jgi:uncharacterized protein YbjT (DUF2867 family)